MDLRRDCASGEREREKEKGKERERERKRERERERERERIYSPSYQEDRTFTVVPLSYMRRITLSSSTLG